MHSIIFPLNYSSNILIQFLFQVNNPNWPNLVKLPAQSSTPPTSSTSPPLNPFEAAQRLAAILQSIAAASSNKPSSEVEEMKVPPISLTGCGAGLPPPPLHFSPDFLWRYPNPFFQPPPSPLESQLKAHLPGGLGSDPRLWLREDVMVFLRYCEREFDLEKIDMEKFQMNGKLYFLLNWANPGLFLCFSIFSIKHVQFYNNVKNVHPVPGGRIRTHNLLIMSLLP